MRTSRLLERRRGGTAIEFALTLPVFLTLIFGMIDYGLYFAGQATLDSVTGANCRSGAELDPMIFDVPTETENNLETVLNTLPLITCAGGGCSVSAQLDGTAPAQLLFCEATAGFQSLTGFTPVPQSIRSTSVQRMEWQR